MLFLVSAALCCALLLSTCDQVKVSTYYNNGAVASSAPIATDIGIQVMKEEGGNAFDAAVAIGFALAVVHPQAGNIGGGGFALIRDAELDTIRSLDFRETAPAAATVSMYLDEDGNVIEGASTFGARAAGVPGTVDGLYALWQEYGSLPWADLVRLAANLADTGFTVDAYLADAFATYREPLSRFDESRRLFFPDGQTPRAGERVAFPTLAHTLFMIAADGPDAFYGGSVADSIVATMERYDGLITHEDLAAYDPIWREPIRFQFDSLDIWSMAPPSSGGIVIGQILKLLEPYDFSSWDPTSPEYIHLYAEMSRLAFADRSEHLGDPAFYDIPARLLDSAYLSRRRALVDELHATPSEAVRPGLPPEGESSETTHFSVCDAAGNMVSITYTLNTSFGSKLAVAGSGFLLNNEMDDFSVAAGVPNTYGLVGGEANKIEPGKRMLSSMSPTIVMKDKEPFLIVGSPGGSRIISSVAQTILNFSRFDQTLAQAVAQPRFHHQWIPDVLYVEQGAFDITTTQSLIRFGHNVTEREPFGDVQAIHIDEAGLMSPASDDRKGGKAAGF